MSAWTELDSFTVVDGVLWSLAVGLTAIAMWIARPRPSEWDLGTLFTTALGALRGSPPAVAAEAYDPRERVGGGADWPMVAAWDPRVAAAVRRRCDTLRVVWLEEPTLSLPEEIPVLRWSLPPGDPAKALDDEAFEGKLKELAERRDMRVAWFATARAGAVLRLLASDEGVRDLTRMIVLVGADLADDAEWIAANFTHANFDLEQARRLPFLTLRVEGAGAQDLPAPPAADLECVEIVDLGLVSPAALDEPAVGRALAISLAASEGWG